MTVEIIQGDCLEVMKGMADNSVDSMVTDPPYGISFMGKKWDYDVPQKEVWAECLRVLKPGGHALIACGTRTQHRMAVNLEDGGFEIRDIIAWVYGSGYPKSHNLGKSVDKLQGNEREVNDYVAPDGKKRWGGNSFSVGKEPDGRGINKSTKGTSPHEGRGTALKPACEYRTLCRKPLSEKTIAKNVLKHGTGGINIDESRVKPEPKTINRDKRTRGEGYYHGKGYFLKNLGHEKYQYEHRFVMEESIGRKLTDNEVVHHINNVKDDNRIDNLELMTLSEHTKLHHVQGDFEYKKRMGQIICTVCGKDTNCYAKKMCKVCYLHEYHKNKSEGRFPANLIHDGSDEVVGLFPYTKTGSMKANVANNGIWQERKWDNPEVKASSGSAARFFKCCKLTEQDCNSMQKHYTMNTLYSNISLCKNIYVDTAEKLLWSINQIKENTALLNVDEKQEELLNHYVKSAEKNARSIEILTALSLVAIKACQGDLEYQEVSQAILDYTTDCKRCIQLLNLVRNVELNENIDITQITKNLLKLFGYAFPATEENTNYEKNEVDDPIGEGKRLIYQAKASKSERNKGLEGQCTHPTLKPIKLMQYLCRLITPVGGTILDPYMGSGSTGIGAKLGGFDFIGIEREEEYMDIARARMKARG